MRIFLSNMEPLKDWSNWRNFQIEFVGEQALRITDSETTSNDIIAEDGR